MQDNHSTGNGNGDNGTLPDMTLKQAVKLLLEEIGIVNREIREDLGGRIDRVKVELGEKIEKLDGKLEGLRMEVHQS
ncbi:MAG: hypothetical protein AAB853_04300 [Patescibacteria group bacterium]